MAISSDQPISAANLKAVVEKLMGGGYLPETLLAFNTDNNSDSVTCYGNVSDYQSFEVDVYFIAAMGMSSIKRVTLQAKTGATAIVEGLYGNVTVTVKANVTNGFSIEATGSQAYLTRVVGYR